MSKKNKHASNQAKYMERKRDAGLEWLTAWVPEPAYQAFKTIAKAARKTQSPPSATRLAEAVALATAQQGEVPDWARESDVLLSVWMASTTASLALDQAQAEREATRTRKAEAKAAKSASPPAVTEPVEEPKVEGQKQEATAAPAPVRRTRKPKVAPTETVSE
ncbi:MAG: hypothetical protein WCF85_08070 [Rhodospirillaceae bacterium]